VYFGLFKQGEEGSGERGGGEAAAGGVGCKGGIVSAGRRKKKKKELISLDRVEEKPVRGRKKSGGRTL